MRKGNETGRACEAEPVAAAVLRVLNEIAAAVLRVLNEIAGHLGDLAPVPVEGHEDRVADQLWYLRNYGVPEGGTSVHDVGKPISHSSHIGFGRPRNMSSSRVCDFWPFGLIKYLPVQVPDWRGELPVLHGVGHNPYSIAEMGGASVGSWYAMPLRIIPERGQVGEDGIEAPNKESWRVLQDDECWSKFANQTGDFGPKARARSSDALTSTGQADVLTGETGSNAVDAAALGTGEFANVPVAGNIGPVLCEDTTGELLYFTESDGLETASALKAKRKAANAAEQVKDAKLAHSRFTPKSAAMWTPRIRTVTISAMVLVPSHMAYAACDWRAVRSTPHFFASLRMAGMRQSGILPVLENFQLDTVDGVRFSAVATLEVPPSASMMAAAFCMPHYYGIRNSFARA